MWWSLEADIGCSPQVLFTIYVYGQRRLFEPELTNSASRARQLALGISCLCLLRTGVTFYESSGDSNSSACVTLSSLYMGEFLKL